VRNRSEELEGEIGIIFYFLKGFRIGFGVD